jgi:hypothetical protein
MMALDAGDPFKLCGASLGAVFGAEKIVLVG